MKYDNSGVRRQDRLLEEQNAGSLLETGEYGVLSLADRHSIPYGIPVNYVWDGKSAIYIHCAPEGRKLNIIAENSFASFCVVGRTNVLPGHFTTEYESIVIRCSARTALTPDERMKALSLLVDKYSPEFKELGKTYSEKSFNRTEIIRLEIIEWSGKSKEVKR